MLARRLLWIVPALVALPLQGQDLQVAELGECVLESGEVLAPCDLAYRTYGELNEARDNAILISTWFGGTSAAWTDILGSGLIDLEGFYTIVVDAFGNGVSTSPTTSPTQGGEAFPLVSIGDMVHSQYRLVTDVMELDGLYGVMGISMGGMQTFEWLVEYPDFFQKAVPIIGSPRLGSYDIARWETELRVLELFEACACEEAAAAHSGLSMMTLEHAGVPRPAHRPDDGSDSSCPASRPGRSEPVGGSLQEHRESAPCHDQPRYLKRLRR